MSDFLAAAGLLVAAAAGAAAILLPPGRLRSLAMLVAIGLFPVLILGDQWHTAQIVDLRHDEGRIVALVAIAAVAIGLLAYLFRRWPILMPLAIVAALPFRIPLHAGGDTANLLVPLYLVIAAGVVATLLRDWSAAAGQLVCPAPSPGCSPPPSSSTRCRPSTRRTSRRGCRTSASSSSPSPSPTGCCARSSGTGGCWPCCSGWSASRRRSSSRSAASST